MTTGNPQYPNSKLSVLAGLLVVALGWACLAHSQTGIAQTYDNEAEDELDFPLSDSETHTRIEAEKELRVQAALYPETLVGRAVRLESGEPVGEVLNVRRHLDNLYIYLVVDATDWFNAPTTYAISVREVERLEAGDIVMELNAGMHVAGMTYYPEDFTSVKNNFPETELPATDN